MRAIFCAEFFDKKEPALIENGRVVLKNKVYHAIKLKDVV